MMGRDEAIKAAARRTDYSPVHYTSRMITGYTVIRNDFIASGCKIDLHGFEWRIRNVYKPEDGMTEIYIVAENL